MKFLILFVAWCVLLVLCWPLALLVALALPVVWLVSIPFRVVLWAVAGVLGLVKGLFLLPARLLQGRPRAERMCAGYR